jgi:CTP:molybdopterin cytidylyltransferase MocA
MSRVPCQRGVVLLAAGSGQRMRPLTECIPKALLPLPGDNGGRTVLDTLIDAVLSHGASDVVVVTGFAAAEVQRHVLARYAGQVRTAYNARWAQDVNIASVACGVAALHHPERGYLVIETDLLLDDSAWHILLQTLSSSDDSFWVTHGVYGAQRTGGVVHAGADGWIDVVDYRPVHDPTCDGWPKMLGMLAVGPGEVAADRMLRLAAMQESLQQYYLMPWKYHLNQLRARVLALDAGLAVTFNNPAEFDAACRRFADQQREQAALHV